MQDILSLLGAQQSMDREVTPDELLKHQTPLAATMRSLFAVLEYEKAYLPAKVFNSMVESLKNNLINSLDNIKMVEIPPMDAIVSINGNPVE